MLGKIKGAVEREDHFEVDDGSGKAFKVAKAALSPRLVDRVRELYCGGKVQGFALGGEALMPPGPSSFQDANEGQSFGQWLKGAITAPFSYDPTEDIKAQTAAIQQAPMSGPLSGAERTTSSVGPAGTPVASVMGGGAPLAPAAAQGVGKELSGFFSGVAKAQAAAQLPPAAPPALPAPAAGPAVGEVPAAVSAMAPTVLPSAAGAVAEAKAAGTEAARKIAEAGELAKKSLEDRAAAEAQARAAEMSAAEGLVRAQDEATRRAEAEAERLRDVYSRGENALRLQKEKLASKEKQLLDPEAMRIETGRVFSRADPVGLMIGAMMVGAAEAGLRKGSGTEAALKVIGDAIDRDVLAQKTEKGALQTARFQAYQAAVGDVNNAAQLLKADQQIAASAAARAEAQRTQSAQGRLMLTQLADNLSAQARKTAEEAVQLITGQALAQQKAASEAETRSMGMRQAEASLIKSAADIENAKRDDARADAQLALARGQLGVSQAHLGLESRKLALAEAEAKGQKIDYDVLGNMGVPLTPAQKAQIKDKQAAASYVQASDDTGAPVYLRARDPDAAKSVSKAQQAAELAKNQLARIEKYIPGPGKTAPSRLFWGEEARKADAEVEAATQALTTQLKEIEQLGALTGADLGLIKPRIPTAQAWFTSDVAERQQALDLRNSIDEMVAAVMHSSVAAPPGGWKKKGGQ